MIQKWYNRIMDISGLTLVIGTLIGIPILKLFDLDAILYTKIVIIVPISGIIFLPLMIWGTFSRHNYFDHWFKAEDISIDRSG